MNWIIISWIISGIIGSFLYLKELRKEQGHLDIFDFIIGFAFILGGFATLFISMLFVIADKFKDCKFFEKKP